MGFDIVGPVEHHFTDYAACPDPFQTLAWIAARTKKIKLITAAVILPWNNPLRVVESALQLDIMGEGRLILGFGRGAARREFRSFGVELKDSREMFDEAAQIITKGVETGIVEADTQWYKIPRTEVRPRGSKSFKDRMVMVTMSPSSVEVAAKFGLQALARNCRRMAEAAGGVDKAYRDYISGNLIGTPEEQIEIHKLRASMVGDYQILVNFSFGGMPYELLYEQMKLFANKVLPRSF